MTRSCLTNYFTKLKSLQILFAICLIAVTSAYYYEAGPQPFENDMDELKLMNDIESGDLIDSDDYLIDRDMFRPPLEIIRRMGYNPEVHEIETEDGYVLTAWRIINENVSRRKLPVLIQHGLFDLSFSWFVNRKKELCLPTILADAGYDVWVLNNRGNRMSRKFTEKVDPNHYWEFTFQEMGRYDLPANVKYIKNITNKEKVYFIGHSQGTTQFFAKMTEDPSFSENIQAFVGLGPVFLISNQGSSIIKDIKYAHIADVLDKLHLHGLLRPRGEYNPLLGLACLKKYRVFVLTILKLVCGEATGKYWDYNILPIVCSHEPGGSSVKNVMHWMQNYQKEGFYYFDYGTEAVNLKHYNQTTPPSYPTSNLKQWTTPTLFISGKQDYLATQEDLKAFLDLLPEEQEKYIETKLIDDYSHIDLVWAQNAAEWVFKDVVEFLEKH